MMPCRSRRSAASPRRQRRAVAVSMSRLRSIPVMVSRSSSGATIGISFVFTRDRPGRASAGHRGWPRRTEAPGRRHRPRRAPGRPLMTFRRRVRGFASPGGRSRHNRIPTPTPVARYVCPNGPRGECVLSTLVIVVSPMKRFNPPCPPCTTNAGTPGKQPVGVGVRVMCDGNNSPCRAWVDGPRLAEAGDQHVPNTLAPPSSARGRSRSSNGVGQSGSPQQRHDDAVTRTVAATAAAVGRTRPPSRACSGTVRCPAAMAVRPRRPRRPRRTRAGPRPPARRRFGRHACRAAQQLHDLLI